MTPCSILEYTIRQYPLLTNTIFPILSPYLLRPKKTCHRIPLSIDAYRLSPPQKNKDIDMTQITTSVGLKGLNSSAADITIVQKLLNQHRDRNPAFKLAIGNPAGSPLGIDGKCGKFTIEAITSFQKIIAKFSKPDGLIEPGKATWKKLNGNIPSSLHIVKRKAVNGYSAMNQLDYKKTRTGHSAKYNLSATGCAVTTLAMAATAIGSTTEHWPPDLTPRNLTPPQANNIFIKAKQFTGGDLIMRGGASALGMSYTEYGRSSNLSQADLTKLNNHLSKGYPAAAHVDYKKSASGDHWILITKRNCDGSYSAIDPLFGGEISLLTTSDSNARYTKERAAKKTGVLFGGKETHNPKAGPKTKKGQQNYIVVRFALLSPLNNKIMPPATTTCSCSAPANTGQKETFFSLFTNRNVFELD